MLELHNIFKEYYIDKKPLPVLKDINLAFSDNGFVSILGPSGCGKTTLLNLIGGLDHYTSGDLLVDGKSTSTFKDSDWDAYRNNRVGFVFQNYNLIPHLTIVENVELSLTLVGKSKKERLQKAIDVLSKVGLETEILKRPNQLSGGQMQRVAIARAMINDPNIILADEPTGALDSVTSMQVMDVLKDISKDRLVIMVTHNAEISTKYSTRQIRLKDGRVVDDTNPVNFLEESSGIEKDINAKTHMSFLTALKISLRNIFTKKGRTILTSVAASFGIIGVALVLALSNGLTSYVENVEAATAASVPISIAPYDAITSTIDSVKSWEDYKYTDEENVFVYSTSTSTTVTHRNNFTQPYEEYVKKLESTNMAKSVIFNHSDLDYNVVTNRGDSTNYFKVDQYSSASSSVASSVGSYLSLPATIFHELYGGKEYMTSLYDVIYGKFPENAHEAVLIVDRYNRVSINYLYRLGFIETNVADNEPTKLTFQDICSKKYKVFTSPEYYGNPTGTTNVTDYSITGMDVNGNVEGQATTKTIESFSSPSLSSIYADANKGIEVSIVGILRPGQSTLLDLMPTSVGYTEDLTNLISASTYTSDSNGNRTTIGMAQKAENAFSIKDIDKLNELITYAKSISLTSLSSVNSSMSTTLESYINGAFGFYNITNQGKDEGIGSLLYQNNYFFKQSHRFGALFESDGTLMVNDDGGLDNNSLISYFMYYLGYSNVTSIIIFPSSLSAKTEIKTYLDSWNKDKENKDQILYADYVETITNNIETMINAVSIILVAFASISLVVSCVMTGIITYISVIERTKEIGILRALGARKKDVGRLFEAESVIVGFTAGIIGDLVAYLLTFPINLIINNIYPGQGLDTIANFSILHALLLVCISIALTFVSGLIPSRSASRKDPVVALRTE